MIPSARLTETHRLAQLRLGALAIAQFRAAFRLLKPDALDVSFVGWLTVVLAIINTHRRTSSTLAAAYLTAFRTLEVGVETTLTPIPAVSIDPDLVSVSLLVTGPISIRKALNRRVPIAKALDIAEARSSAAAMRHVLNAGRETIIETVKADPKALGFSRAASGDACAWCAMLASRGPVYKTEQSATLRDDGERYHDACACTPVPVYTPDAEWPDHSRAYKQQWAEATRGLSGPDALAAFRKALGRGH